MRLELRRMEVMGRNVLIIHVKKWRQIYYAFNYTFARWDSPILEMMILEEVPTQSTRGGL